MEVGVGKWGRASNNHLGLGNLFIGSVEVRGQEAEMSLWHLLMQLLFILLFTWEINGFSHTAGPRVFIIGSGLASGWQGMCPAWREQASGLCGAQGLCRAGLIDTHHLYTAY